MSATVTYPSAYISGFAITVGNEGGLSLDSRDRGNYRSGVVGVGPVVGSKYGLSAAAYPTLDIPNVTLDTARAIYFTDYWLKARCDLMPGRLAATVFDSAVNNGVSGAVRLLQTALGLHADAVFGPGTVAALQSCLTKTGEDSLCAEFLARRLVLMAALPSWPSQALGWSRRICKMPFLTQGFSA